MVKVGCKPGPSTILTDEEEDKLAAYLITIADMGYGIKQDSYGDDFYDCRKSHRKHPFKEEKGGCAWFEDFQRCHLNLTICSPQSYSYNRAISAN